MSNSQFLWRHRLALITVMVLIGVAELDAQKAPFVSFDRGFAPVVKQVLPAVVNIASSRIVRTSPEAVAPFSDPFFDRFFGGQNPVPRERREHSLGSGVIVDRTGYVMTNNHVIEGASEIKIALLDKREFNARVVGADPKTDIAVLKIDAMDLPVLQFGDSSLVEVGEFVLAVGNPFGVGQTVTLGIVSATGRGGFGIETYEDFIQTDAPINPGNSGGAMVNARGDLIGINTAMVSGQGVGFAVPINLAQQVMNQIRKHGKVIRGFLGTTAQTMSPQMMHAFGLSGQPRGALVTDVMPDSPAARSGLLKGDIILEINGQPLEDSRSLSLKVSMTPPGTKVRLKIFRDGSPMELTATLAELEEKAVASTSAAAGRDSHGPRFGITVTALTPTIMRTLGLPAGTQGVVVSEVQPGSVAEEAGLRMGDVIQEVNRNPVANMAEYQKAMNSVDTMVMLLVNRRGDHAYVALEGPAEPVR
jgi:serine protease Do